MLLALGRRGILHHRGWQGTCRSHGNITDEVDAMYMPHLLDLMQGPPNLWLLPCVGGPSSQGVVRPPTHR
jgi:hypothetical protein